jgi:hypothetical protein
MRVGWSRYAVPVTVALTLLALLTVQVAAPTQTATPAAAAVASPDPANSAFSTDAGLILVAIKPAAIADYEQVIRALQGALASDTDAVRKAATKNWRVFKASSGDAKGNALYIHVMLPAVPGFDYRPSLLVDTLVKDLAPELLTKYQDAFAGPPSKLDLTELANMAIAPIPLPVAKAPETKKPGR